MFVTFFVKGHGFHAVAFSISTQERTTDVTPTIEFQPFPKIARLTRDCVITEKIDGTNAQVHITHAGDVLAGSRTRWLTPGKQDDFGFAAWVDANKQELLKQGPGRHFGEWWGSGIQRGYGPTNGQRRFSLFNTAKWSDPLVRPACCDVVPVLYSGVCDSAMVELSWLRFFPGAANRPSG